MIHHFHQGESFFDAAGWPSLTPLARRAEVFAFFFGFHCYRKDTLRTLPQVLHASSLQGTETVRTPKSPKMLVPRDFTFLTNPGPGS